MRARRGLVVDMMMIEACSSRGLEERGGIDVDGQDGGGEDKRDRERGRERERE